AQDLIDAANVLPETWPAGQEGRATKWQAKAVLAKLYMNWSSPYDGSAGYGTGNKWSEVASILDDIIANGKDAKGTKYTLAPTYDALWHYETSDWTGESVFDVQFTFNGTTSQTNSPHHTYATEFSGALGYGGWGFYQPSFEFVNSHIVDANGLPLSFAEYTAHKPLTPVGSANTDLSVFTDPRLDVSAGRFGVPYLDWLIPYNVSAFIRDYGNGGMYFNKKGHSWKAERAGAATTHPVSTAINYHIIRFAEILLMRAECYYQEGNYAKVIEIVNQIRERAAKGFVAYQEPSNDDEAALVYKGVMEDMTSGSKVVTEGAAANYRIGLYPASYANAAQAREALEREYRLEFGMEGHRWFDIARWGKAADVLNAYAKAESQYLGKFINTYQASWVNFPIPQAEVQTAQGRFVQTQAWK
ncbi:MAG: RagB/SusD family nutrient uptake outer membrane protein, partial [Alistipes sp.]|nr:RagB/SusD family nutrient uptake outer membrane protein [Alistipes sp.]